MDNLSGGRVTYRKGKCGPPAITTARFEAVATSPRSHEKSTSRSFRSSRNPRRNGCAVVSQIDGSAIAQNLTDHANISTLMIFDDAVDHRLDERTVRYLSSCPLSQRKRLFQTHQRRIRSSVVPSCTSDRQQEDILPLSSYQTRQIASRADLQLEDGVGLNNDNSGTSSIESYSSTPALKDQGRPLSVLRRQLYSYTLEDVPLKDLRARKNRRIVRPDALPDLLGYIGDGFEPAERMSRHFRPTTKRRRAARPKSTRCRQLVLVAGSSPAVDISSYNERPSPQLAVNDAEAPIEGVQHRNSSDDNTQHEVAPAVESTPNHIVQNCDVDVQQLFQSISAPIRPPTPETEVAESYCTEESHETDTLSKRSPCSDESWSGLVATPEQHSPGTQESIFGLDASPSALGSPVSSLISSSDIFESLEDGPNNTITTRPDEAIPQHELLTRLPSSVLGFPQHELLTRLPSSVLGFKVPFASCRRVEILCSEGAVLETSQPPG